MSFEIGADDAVTCRFTVSDDDDGYDDDPGGPGFVFDSPFDDAGQTDQPNPSPTGADPTLAGVIAGTNHEVESSSGGGHQHPAGAEPAVGPLAVDELPRTGFDLLPMGLAVGLILTVRGFSALSRRRKAPAA